MASYTSKFAVLFCVSLLQIVAGQNAPEIFVAPSAMHVDYGSTAYMACVAYLGTESQSIGVVTQMNWYNPHSQLLSNNSDGSSTVYTTTKTQNGEVFLKSILKICNFTTDDFGSYTCRVTNIFGQNEKSWIVSIVRLPVAPQLLTSPQSVTTSTGRTVYMTCSAYGYPYPAIIWSRNGQVVQSDGILTIDTRVRNYNGVNVSESTLKICGADSEYVGSYTCTANVRDIGQVTSNSWRLDVRPVASISSAPDDHTISYGVTAYLTCTAYLGTMAQGANQISSTLSWIGPNTQQINNRTDGTVSVYTGMDTQSGQVFLKSYLKICNFTQVNSGQYSCRVSNANGQDNKTFAVSLPYPVALPRLLAVPSTQTVREGNTVYMTCAVYGYPFPDVTWYKNGQVLTPAVSSGLLTINTYNTNYNGAQVTQSDLKICLIDVADSGDYSCRATTRDFGMLASQSATLTVLPTPSIIISPESQVVTYGTTFFMTCAAHVGNTAQNANQLGTTLTWWGPDGQALTNSTGDVTVFTDTQTTQAGHVIIKSIIQICGFAPELEGTYSCVVSNSNGADMRSWNNTLPSDPIAPVVLVSPSTQTVNEGNSVLMTCAGYGSPSPRITWYQNGQPLDPYLAGRVTITTRYTYYLGAPVTESIMKICGAAEEDHGSYYCSFRSAFGNAVSSNTWQVNVSPAPTIVVAPQDNQVEYSRTIYMTCAAHVGTVSQNAGSITTTFNWLGPDAQPIDSSQVTTDISTQSGRVFVRSVMRVCNFDGDDAGQYTCRVSNANGNENRTWTVSFPQTPVTPQLAAISAYDYVTYGNSVYMACAMYGYPQPQITWTRDNTALDTISTTVTTSYVVVNGVNITQSVVRVCGFQSANTGLYLCTATNALGSSNGYVKVISEAPEIVSSPSNRLVNYGHTIYMSCVAYIGRMNRSVDQLTTTFTWWDNSNRQLINSSDGSVSIYTDSSLQNGLVFMRSVLKLCNFTMTDTGQHTCTAMNSNGQGSASWNLTFLRPPMPPQFLVTPGPSAFTTTAGRTVYMDCAAYGFPFPQVTWSRNGQVIYPNNTKYRITYGPDIVNYGGALVSQSLLKICGAGEEDIGTYACTATVDALTSTITTPSVTLNVNPVPTLVVAPTDQEVTFGKTTLMTCVGFIGLTSQNAATIPTTITWTGPLSQQLLNSTDNSVSVYTRTTTQGGRVFIESILKMCDISPSDEGEYSCTVLNNFGTETRTWNATLHQSTFAPTVVAYPVQQSSRRFGYSVLMACAGYGYPPPTFTFTQRGQPISQVDLDGGYTITNNVMRYAGGVTLGVGVLEICGFDYDDIGNYTCTANARNIGMATSGAWTVSLIAAPFLVSSPMSQVVNYNTVLRMTCIAALGRQADVQPTTISWFDKNGTPMNNNSAGVTVVNTMYTNSSDSIVYLRSDAVVSNIGLQHLGELSCTANNSLGSDVSRWNITPALDLAVPQNVAISNSNQVINCGDAVTVTCTAWGYPPPTIFWTINSSYVSTSLQMDTLGANSTTSNLMIGMFNRTYSGVYVCNATNLVGQDKSQAVLLSLNIVESTDVAKPTISSTTRTSSELAVVEFKPVSNNANQEFEVSYYVISNSTATPDVDQLPKAGSVQSKQTQVSVGGLDACTTYWAVVTVVNGCGVRRSPSSTAARIGLYDVMNFQLRVTLSDKPCSTWITEDTNLKITDVIARLQLAATSCGVTLPCPFASSQWTCQTNEPTKATFTTQLIGSTDTPSTAIVSCFTQQVKDAGGSLDIMIGGVSYPVGVVPVGSTGSSINTTAVGVAVVVVAVVVVGIIIAIIIAAVMFRGRNKKPAKKEKLVEEQQDVGDLYSRHSFAVVENPLFADQEEGDDTSYAGGAEGYEYDSGTLDKKEDLGAEDYLDEDDDKSFI